MRTILSALLGLMLCVGAVAAADKKADDKKADPKKGMHAKITSIDVKKHSLVVTMKDKDGKESTKTFKLAEEVVYADSTGKVVAAEVFKSGDEVLVLEEDGKVKEVHQSKKK